MGMQETAAAAQVHSCSCGLALIEEVAVPPRVGAVLEDLNRERDAGKDRLTINSEDLWNSALIGHLVRLADGGCFQSEERCGKGQADMEVGLEDPNNELAAENLRLMKEDQRSWIEPQVRMSRKPPRTQRRTAFVRRAAPAPQQKPLRR